MSSKSKRQQTMAKRNREHAVEEKRWLKREKKQAAAAARSDEAAGITEAVRAPEGEPIDVG
jgi:hypothetical protein